MLQSAVTVLKIMLTVQVRRENSTVKHTYLSSGEWAAMRDRRLLSASGHPERLEEKE